MASCLSPASLYTFYLHRKFSSAGLQSRTTPIDAGETTLHYWLSSPTTPPLPTLVLIHGFGPESSWQWGRQVRPLSRRFRLVVPDLVFFGRSTTASPLRSEVFQAECVAKLLRELGADRFSVLGTSYGGFVAYHLARICGGRVDRVVVASSDLLKRDGENRGLLGKAGFADISDLLLPRSAEAARVMINLMFYRPPRGIPDFCLKDFVKRLYGENREEKVELIKGVTLDRSDGLEKIPHEVLIVWGEHDNVFPLEKAYKIKQQVGEKVQLEVIKNTGHLPQMEDPDRFNKVVLNFLLGTSSTSSSK